MGNKRLRGEVAEHGLLDRHIVVDAQPHHRGGAQAGVEVDRVALRVRGAVRAERVRGDCGGEVVRDFAPDPGVEEISEVIVRKIGLPKGFLYLPMPVRARAVTETIPWGEHQPTGDRKQDAEKIGSRQISLIIYILDHK